jgi:hypothetical protein
MDSVFSALRNWKSIGAIYSNLGFWIVHVTINELRDDRIRFGIPIRWSVG